MYTVETAPPDTPILVWVRDANKDGSGAWKPGRVLTGYDLPPVLAADSYNGPWDIPYWTPYPKKPDGEK